MSQKSYYVGVDVGTHSARAALVSSDGKVTKTSSLPIKTWNPSPGFYEQSTNDIWFACTEVVQSVTRDVDRADIKGIGFDATCSLVALDKNFQPVSLSLSGCPEQNIILWMDHRALDEAKHITNLAHAVLKNIGGKMSPEMQPPKMLWLKKNLPSQWNDAEHIFDLPDFLTWKATGSLSRSLCSLVCKFLYQPEKNVGWDVTFWSEIGLEEITSGKIGNHSLPPGQRCGNGLTEEAANDLKLLPNTPVSTSVIDCYAGAIGVLGCCVLGEVDYPLDHRMAMISGTSACHVKVHKDPILTPGVWGPYFSAMLPGMYCVEAGQSAAGCLIDHVINTHPASKEMKKHCGNRYVTDVLNDQAKTLAMELQLLSLSHLTADVHVYPDYHGNRSPLAEPELTGMVCGLTLACDKNDLIKKYVATVQALAYSTRHIVGCLQDCGHVIKTLIICGGLGKNSLYVQMHADVLGLPVIVPDESEPVLLGAAVLGATAAGQYPDLVSAMRSMCGPAQLVEPSIKDKIYHEKKYRSFMKLLQYQKEIQTIMNS